MALKRRLSGSHGAEYSDASIGTVRLIKYGLENVFFRVEEYSTSSNSSDNRLSIIKKDFDDDIFYMCSGKYTKDDFILFVIANDYSSGFAFTHDSFCYISDGYGRKGKGIIKYTDIKHLDYGTYDFKINNIEIHFDKIHFSFNYQYMKSVLANICNALNVEINMK